VEDGGWETKWFVSWFICVMSNWLNLVWIWIRCILVELIPNWVIWFGETHLLVSWCVGGECDIASSDENHGRSNRLGAEDWGWSGTSRVLGGRTIERSDGAVCDLHRAQGEDERKFLGLASKPRSTISLGLASKPVATVLVVWHQNHSLGFPSLGLKTSSYGLVIWPTKSSR
jgi:hypothetical protein